MKPLSEFITAVLGIAGMIMLLLSFQFAVIEIIWATYAALILHTALVALALPYLIRSLFYDRDITPEYRILLGAISLLNAVLMWGLGSTLGLGSISNIIIVLEFTPIVLIVLDLYLDFWEDRGYLMGYPTHLY